MPIRTKSKPRRVILPVVIQSDESGYYATCPSLPGCSTQGESYEEALKNIEDAVRLYLEDLLADGQPLPTRERASLTTVEIEV